MKIISSLLLVLTFQLVGLTAMAEITGEWNGWAYWKYDGDGPKCTARMNFEETREKFSVFPGLLDCGIATMDIPTKVFKKASDGTLVYAKEIVGKWTEKSFEWSEPYNERTVINVKITVEGNHLDYHEIWIQDGSKLLYDIKGRLFRAPLYKSF